MRRGLGVRLIRGVGPWLGFLLAVPGWTAGPGTSAGTVLLQDTQARLAALGGAMVAGAGDLTPLSLNPAGLQALSLPMLIFTHTGGMDGLAMEYLAAGVPISGLGTLAAQVLYQGQPPIDNDVPTEATVEVKDLVLGVAFASSPVAGLSWGANAKFWDSTLGNLDRSTLVLDLGLRYVLDPQWAVGLALRNLGSIKYQRQTDPLPESLQGGVSAIAWKEAGHELLANADVETLVHEQTERLRLGAEYRFKQALTLRMGYVLSNLPGVQGFTAGVGFGFKAGKVRMQVDYAMLPQSWEPGAVQIKNVLSLTARFEPSSKAPGPKRQHGQQTDHGHDEGLTGQHTQDQPVFQPEHP